MVRNIEKKDGESPRALPERETWLWEMQADMCQILANPKRLQIINLLKWGELSVGALVKAMGVAKPNLSQHLSVMRQKGILSTRREGTTIFYRLAVPNITEACEIMREVLLQALSAKSERLQTIAAVEEQTKDRETE